MKIELRFGVCVCVCVWPAFAKVFSTRLYKEDYYTARQSRPCLLAINSKLVRQEGDGRSAAQRQQSDHDRFNYL